MQKVDAAPSQNGLVSEATDLECYKKDEGITPRLTELRAASMRRETEEQDEEKGLKAKKKMPRSRQT